MPDRPKPLNIAFGNVQSFGCTERARKTISARALRRPIAHAPFGDICLPEGQAKEKMFLRIVIKLESNFLLPFSKTWLFAIQDSKKSSISPKFDFLLSRIAKILPFPSNLASIP